LVAVARLASVDLRVWFGRLTTKEEDGGATVPSSEARVGMGGMGEVVVEEEKGFECPSALEAFVVGRATEKVFWWKGADWGQADGEVDSGLLVAVEARLLVEAEAKGTGLGPSDERRTFFIASPSLARPPFFLPKGHLEPPPPPPAAASPLSSSTGDDTPSSESDESSSIPPLEPRLNHELLFFAGFSLSSESFPSSRSIIPSGWTSYADC
jgi:hypothetical protein